MEHSPLHAQHTLHVPLRSNSAPTTTAQPQAPRCAGRAPQTPHGGGRSTPAARPKAAPSPGIAAAPQGGGTEGIDSTCSNRQHRSLPETPANAALAPCERPRRAGGAAAAAGSTPGPAARSSMSAAWQHNREQVTSAPAVALLQEASTQASDAAAPPETHALDINPQRRDPGVERGKGRGVQGPHRHPRRHRGAMSECRWSTNTHV